MSSSCNSVGWRKCPRGEFCLATDEGRHIDRRHNGTASIGILASSIISKNAATRTRVYSSIKRTGATQETPLGCEHCATTDPNTASPHARNVAVARAPLISWRFVLWRAGTATCRGVLCYMAVAALLAADT